MKKRRKITYGFVLFIISIFITYGIVKKIIVSSKIKNVIITKFKEQLPDTDFNIQKIDMSPDNIMINKITLNTNDSKIIINRVAVNYSMFKLFSKGINFKEWLKGISIHGINVIVKKNKPKIDKSEFNWDLDISKYKAIISKIGNYSYLNKISIDNVTFSVDDGKKKLKIFPNLNGFAKFEGNSRVLLNLRGKVLESQRDNIFLKGDINYKYMTSNMIFRLKKAPFPKIKDTFIPTKGSYSGKLTFELNKNSNGRMNLYGNLKIDSLSGHIKEKLDISDLNILLSFYNGNVFFNQFSGFLLKSKMPFSISGTLYNILNPEFDTYLSISKFKDNDVKKIFDLVEAKDNKNINFGDNNSLYIHAFGKEENYSLLFDYTGDYINFNNRIFSDITSNGGIYKDYFDIKNINCITGTNVVNLNGKSYFAGEKKGFTKLKFKATGSLFSEFKVFENTKMSNLSTILKGNFTYTKKDGIILKSNLEAYDFSSSNSASQGLDYEFRINLDVLKNSIKTNLISKSGEKLLYGNYNIKKENYSLSSDNLLKIIKFIYPINDASIFENKVKFNLKGNFEKISLLMNSINKTNNLTTHLLSEISLEKDFVSGVVNLDAQKDLFYLPLSFKLLFNKKKSKFELYSFKSDQKEFIGSIGLNTNSKKLFGALSIKKFNLASFFKSPIFKTKTDLNLKLYGNTNLPYADFSYIENELSILDLKDKITGNIELRLAKDNLRIEKIIFNQNKKNIITLTGYINSFKKYALEFYGHFPIQKILGIWDIDFLKGDLQYKIKASGTFDNPSLISGKIEISDMLLGKTRIDNIFCSFKEKDKNGIFFDKLNITASQGISFRAKGFLPLNTKDEMDINGYFYGNAMKIVSTYVPILENSTSSNEGVFSLKGTIAKPRIDNFQLYFLDGTVFVKDITKALGNIKAKMTIDENLKLHIVKLHAKSNGKRIFIKNYDKYDNLEQLILPIGINIGILGISFPDGGIPARIPGFMKRGVWGDFTITGFRKDEFLMANKNGNLTIIGKLLLRNTSFSFPYMDNEVVKEPILEDDDWELLDYLNFDVEIVPISGNRYFYEVKSLGNTIWEKFKNNLFNINTGISNLDILVSNRSDGLKIKGNINNKYSLTGNIEGSDGTLQYSGLNFNIEKGGIRFDGYLDKDGSIDPYIFGYGKTMIRSKIDTSRFVSYEDVFVRIVDMDKDEIIDSEGGRLSSFSIQLTNADGEPWLNDIAKNDKLKDIDTKETLLGMFNTAVDSRLFNVVLSPLETSLSNFFGAYITFRPSVVKNLQSEDLYSAEKQFYLGSIFEGSEVFISKFFNDIISLNFHAKYIGDIQNHNNLYNEYGYFLEPSIGFRLGNHIMTSAGWAYNSLYDDSGYNLSFSYRYKFRSLNEKAFRRFRQRIKEFFR